MFRGHRAPTATELTRVMPPHVLAIREAADALAVIDKTLTTIEYLMADPLHCQGSRARLEKDRAALAEVIRWVQERLAESWRVAREAHPERAPAKRVALRGRESTLSDWRAWSAAQDARHAWLRDQVKEGRL